MTVIRRRNPKHLVLGVLVGLLFLVFAGELVWMNLVAPRLVIRKISLESDLKLTDGQLMEMLSIKGLSWAQLDEKVLESRLESYPVIRKAQVVKVFPDTLRLFIYRRKPLAVVLVDSRNMSVPAVFDEEGYAVQVGGSSGSFNLPILSGLSFPLPALGARLPESLRPLLADLSSLRNDDSRLFGLVSEVEVVPRSGNGYDLRLYMNHVAVPVLIERKLDAETLRQAVLVLDVLASGEAGRIEEADIRGGHVVFRRRKEI